MRKALEGFKGGLQIGDRRITNLRYADDIILITTSEDELQELVKRVHEASRKYDLLINVHKTKTMVIAGKKCNIFVGMEKLEQVNSFPYLGSVFRVTRGNMNTLSSFCDSLLTLYVIAFTDTHEPKHVFFSHYHCCGK